MAYGLQRSVAVLEDAFAEAKPAEAGHTCEANDNVFSNGRWGREFVAVWEGGVAVVFSREGGQTRTCMVL